MSRRDTPGSRPRRLEIFVFLAVAVYLAVFLAAGTSDRIALFLQRAQDADALGRSARHVVMAGSGVMAALGIVMARVLRATGTRRQLLFASLASAMLGVWQVAHMGGRGVYGAACAAVAALAFAFAAWDAKGPPGGVSRRG